MASYGGQYTVTATATSLTNALGLSAGMYCANIDVKAPSGNSGVIYLGPSTVTNVPANARVAIAAGEGWSSGPTPTHIINTDQLYIVGTANDIAFIHLLS